ncbi:tripartite tricarboxylate transporter substrate binding protein [Cupriavidus basilensis]|uniref:Tricarboxylate transport protein TctC n=1 Tax=Cupriavidus basilensis TaxID=68895 RepID=A0A0C4YWM1_9BURK|nr:tripartite tricarboxylate transporter substrate binding protein [Cupriavidus basilensis]AJG24896.1 Tricarboxylate transport protein TctC [Cupriavidus basilensis]QOT79860.1 tripartite tricarboxylate transporter substrate binding protein [Cupriavidus basilensis]
MHRWTIRCTRWLALCGWLAATASAFAAYPDKPVRLVVPFPPGGATDLLAREVSHALSVRLGQSVVIENRPGAGGNIAAVAVARAPADGYTLLFGTFGSLAVNKSLYDKPGYDPLKDFAPVASVAYLPNVLVVHPSVPARNVAELLALARREPGKLTYGSFGNGSSSHLAGELFTHMAGVRIDHVPYKGSAPAMTDLIGGRLTMMFDSISTALPYVRDGRVRALAVTTAKPSEQLPGVPTLAAAGVPGYELTAWFGVVAPANTPAAIVDRLNAEIVASLAQPELAARLASQGTVPFPSTPAQFGTYMRTQYQKWDGLIKSANIHLDQ